MDVGATQDYLCHVTAASSSPFGHVELLPLIIVFTRQLNDSDLVAN